MGEIKSTLDLVMEKTKNLSLSDEEKQEHKNKEIAGRILGLLSKFQDKTISLEGFHAQYRTLKQEYSLMETNDFLVKEICGQIQPGKDNQAMLDLLTEFKVPNVERLKSVLEEFQAVNGSAAEERCKVLKDRLAKTHFISGSAVVPNLGNDDEWRHKAGEIKAEFEAKLKHANNELLAG